MMPARIRDWSPRHWLALAAGVALIDQLTKIWASATLEYLQPVAVLPFFNLTLLHNTGAAFSFLSDAGGWQRWFFIVLTVAISAVLIAWLHRGARGKPWLSLSLALILSGAIGNVIDRIRFGYVVDFLDFHAFGWHWPAFNVADSAITLGAVLLIVDGFRHEEKRAKASS
jgi:signal peptidase II